MKIRYGFVSNSSSSSFIALIPKDEWNKFSLSVFEKAVINVSGCIEDVMFNNTECVSFGYVSGNYSTLEDVSNEEIQKEVKNIYGNNIDNPEYVDIKYIKDCKWNVLSVIKNKIRQLPKDKAFIHTEEF